MPYEDDSSGDDRQPVQVFKQKSELVRCQSSVFTRVCAGGGTGGGQPGAGDQLGGPHHKDSGLVTCRGCRAGWDRQEDGQETDCGAFWEEAWRSPVWKGLLCKVVSALSPEVCKSGLGFS